MPKSLLLFLLLPGVLSAQSFSWGAEADFNGRYLWRGIAYTNGPVFQPSFWVTRGLTTIDVWSNMVLDNEPHQGRFDEIFISATREIDMGRWKVEPDLQGYYWQGFRGEENARTLELSIRASRPVGPLSFFTSHTVDIGEFRGSYVGDAGLERKKTVRGLDWEGSGMIAWANTDFNRAYVGVDRPALNYAQWGVAVTRHVRGWYLRPHAELVRSFVDARTLFNAGIAVGREH